MSRRENYDTQGVGMEGDDHVGGREWGSIF